MSFQHPHQPDVGFDGGDLDCGNGLLLLIRKHIDPLPRGGLLEIRSTEISVDEDLPAWCRMTGNELVSFLRDGKQRSFLVAKGKLAERTAVAPVPVQSRGGVELITVKPMTAFPPVAPAPAVPPLSVMGIGSWPRPRWMLQAVHEHMEGRLPDAEFHATADDAVRLAVTAQLRAGADVVSDGEQRRDSYSSFVASRLDNTQLIPLTDLLPLVDDPEEFERELRALDVPAGDVRHPAVFGPLGRSRGIAVHEVEFAKSLTRQPVKVALPGPYLLTRTMWMECISDRAYANREDLANDIVRVLREEIACLLAAGTALVQLDEPVLSEVVFSGPATQRSFMCGALSEKGDPAVELAFARDLVNAVVAGFPRERLALHMCRGNWTPDETKALAGDYRPLVDTLGRLQVGTLFLELATPRAGEMEVLKSLPDDMRIGVGACNQKHAHVESVEHVLHHAEHAVQMFGAGRVLLTPDCGFATFADNPLNSAATAEAKLAALAGAARILRERHRIAV
ncbi:5-methyltetrahydropteroyltriglutamate--homocysteine methyltransferase [Massilia sp. YIM B02763]|uniref:5-methyltetrahydropteroyltriglutamate-- homocysteine methyltransferase n=1 Tax=Massilia sp. YIM B02763 TaxID=3050130 RepID=UPI0025B71B27|nr:5-methyltetrahydropteroyltriglutamate--homocysteine methyltransferase [Massilia sp. YIM B02763]MDN4053109.1 5-methyltetrahydropteroyltriglutamate--homocysteine methyltransferase [Massilia sp. YIM B02763]